MILNGSVEKEEEEDDDDDDEEEEEDNVNIQKVEEKKTGRD